MMRTSYAVVTARRVAALLLTATSTLAAQSAPSDSSWLARVSVSARYGVLAPSGQSEIFSLMERALDPGTATLNPRLTGADVQLRVSSRWSVALGLEAGERTIGSVSRVLAATTTSPSAQETALQLTAVQSLGAEWRAARWRAAGGTDHARLMLGAGVGRAQYRFRQWGAFVDASRQVGYRDDFYSTGRGMIGYASAAVEVPVRRWVALQGTVRQQLGSAPMSDDYASFNRLDLSGSSWHVGARFWPTALLRRR